MRWMKLEPIIWSEVGQKEKDKFLFIYFFIINTYTWNPKTSTDEPICRVAIEMYREKTCGHSGGRRGWDKLKE